LETNIEKIRVSKKNKKSPNLFMTKMMGVSLVTNYSIEVILSEERGRERLREQQISINNCRMIVTEMQ